MLTLADHRSISRQVAAGVPLPEIAAEFGISVRDVMRIDRREREKQTVRRRMAEPLPGLKALDWKTARPAEDRIRRGESCRSIGCEGTVERGSYCLAHAALLYAPRAA